MATLNKEQKKKLDNLVGESKLFEKINELLAAYGAEDLKIASFRVQPVKETPSSHKMVLKRTGNALSFDFSSYPPICPHGQPMVNRCTTGGSCQWVCHHQ